MKTPDKRKVLIVTGQHFAGQPRKVDLHFMAEALNEQGVHVDFLSLRLSLASRFIHDGRWEYAKARRHNRWIEVSPLLDEFIWVNTIHPMNLSGKAANWLSGQIFRHYSALLPGEVIRRLSDYTHILVESGISVLLLHRLRILAPQACLIYHAADRLSTIGTHPAAVAHLKRHSSDIDLAHVMAEAIKPDIPSGVPVIYLPHGISKAGFAKIDQSPFSGQRNVVSVGDMLFDPQAVKILAEAFPDWTFHLFGRLAALADPLPNVVTHGERPFDEIVGYIKFADIGLAPYADAPDADYLSQSSLKMIQYTFCRLPIVAPHFASAGRNHVHGYDPLSPETLKTAFANACRQDREMIDISQVMSWQEKTSILLEVADRQRGLPISRDLHLTTTAAFAR